MFEKNQRDKSEYIKAGNEIPRRKSKENFNKYNENKESGIEEIENNNEEIENNNEEIHNNNEEIHNNNEEIQNYEQKYTIQELLQDNKLLELIKAKLGDKDKRKHLKVGDTTSIKTSQNSRELNPHPLQPHGSMCGTPTFETLEEARESFTDIHRNGSGFSDGFNSLTGTFLNRRDSRGDVVQSLAS